MVVVNLIVENLIIPIPLWLFARKCCRFACDTAIKMCLGNNKKLVWAFGTLSLSVLFVSLFIFFYAAAAFSFSLFFLFLFIFLAFSDIESRRAE